MKFKSAFKYYASNILSVLVLIAMSCVMLIENRIVGLVMLCVSAVFAIVLCLLRINEFRHLKNSVILINESLSEINKDRICTVPLPFVICSDDGRIIWYNDSFASCAVGHDDFSEDMFSGIISDYALDSTNYTKSLDIFDRKYSAFISLVKTDSDSVYQIYLIDDTYYKDIESEYNFSRPVVIMISIDAADEASVVLSHSLYTSFISDIEKKITEWFSDKSCITRKIGDNRFIAVTEYRNLLKMIEARFDIMDEVRNYKINDKTSGFTLSIGIGTGGLVTECEQFSRQALDMARGRGGDQTAIKNGENYQFFGGVSDGVEKRGQIRSRLIAKAIEEAIKKASNVIIMGHTGSDLDALGSAVGLACAVRNLDTNVHIAVDEKTSLARPLISHYNDNADDNLFISSAAARQLADQDTLLIITDVMRSRIVDSPELYAEIENVIVIDHHRMSVDHIENALVFYHEPTASSASEMVTELIEYMPSKPRLSPVEAECLLAGIYLDTKNFTLKSGVRTFEAAAYLKDMGADTISVRKMFSASMEEYKLVNSIVSNAVFKSNYALAYTDKTGPEVHIAGAKAADELLNIDNVDASFVAYYNAKGISVSARSYGRINVQLIMEDIGGGGHQTMAAAQIDSKSFDEVFEKLNNSIEKFI